MEDEKPELSYPVSKGVKMYNLKEARKHLPGPLGGGSSH